LIAEHSIDCESAPEDNASMSTSPNPFFDTALSLPAADRADLAFQLLQSLDLPGEEANTDEFGTELNARIESFRRGEIATVSLDEARAIIERRLEKGCVCN
jgi:putative addiction module component (TIGR02574 family)